MDRPAPPRARAADRVEDRHGDRRDDPYFWLRHREDPEVIAYLEAENAYAEADLAGTRELQEELYREMRAHLRETDSTVPAREGHYFYYSRTEEGRQYAIHCRRAAPDAPEEILLDSNALADGPFLALGDFAVSDDGRLLAYSLDRTGYRQYTMEIKDLSTGKLRTDSIERVTSADWAADDTLLYTVEDSAKRPYRLYRRDGEGRDTLIWEETDERFSIAVSRCRSREFLFLQSESHTASETRYCRADSPGGPWMVFWPRAERHEYEVEHAGEFFYVRTNRDSDATRAENFRLVRVPVSRPFPPEGQELIAHRANVIIESVDAFDGHLVVSEREAGLPHVRILDSGGDRRLDMPEPVYAVSLTGNREFRTSTVRYRYESLVTPPEIRDFDLATGRTVVQKRLEVPGYEPDLYVSERLFAPATDGRRIPISIVHRRDRPPGGSLDLAGYGAYGYPYPIAFSSTRLCLLDRGVAFAITHIRGGGELGKSWHEEGRMAAKSNSFSDFVAAAEFLVARGETRPDRLAIEGGSAGGLLVTAAVNLRPQLFRAVVARVPFVDVLNTMLDPTLPLTIGEYEEWGNPESPDEYAQIRAWSPYDNLAPGRYPAMLIKASLHDSQVPYWEAAKYVARLRTRKSDDRPLLLVTNLAAGHGGASGRYDHLRELALDYAFVLREIGVVSRD